MEGTGYAHAHHCTLQSGSSCCNQCALHVDVQPSSPTSPAPSLQFEERGHDDTQVNSPPPRLAEGSDGDSNMSPSHCCSNSHIAPQTESLEPSFVNHSAPEPLHLPSHSHQKQLCSPESPPNHSQQHDGFFPPPPPPRTLDPNAREFTPPLQPSLQIAIDTTLNMQPVYTTHSEIRVSVCYQTSVTAMQGPCCTYELVDTSLPPSEIVTANNNIGVSTHTLHVQTVPSPFENEQGSQFIPYRGFTEDCVGVEQHVINGSRYIADEASQMGSIGFRIPVHDGPPVYNPPILANPHVGFLPPTAIPLPPPSPAPPVMPPCIPLACPNGQPITHRGQQAVTVYTHKHFRPQSGWKEHISRALLISGIPPHLTESQLRLQLEQWGHIRALHTDKLPQGILSVQFFDLRTSRQALRDMQNQHLLRQQRFQEHLYAQSGMQFHNYRLQSGASEQGLSSRGLLGGHVVWAQYIAAWSVPVPDGHNQGTLVLFNVGADVSLQRLQQVFEKYGHVRELREAPTKRQHKFVEFFDVRDAEAAWTALNGQDVCGKCVKIEFSRQGGPVHKQKSAPVLVHHDMVAIGHEALKKDSVFCGWQSHSSNGAYYQQEWHAKPYEGDPLSFPTPDTVMFPNNFLGPDDSPYYGSSIRGYESYVNGAKDHANHMQGAVAGPRRKHSIFRPHPKVCHALVHDTNNALAMRPVGPLQRNVSTRGHPHFEYDEREVYLISGQPRTTLMIKNIPNKYSQQMLLSLLDHHCVEFNSQILDLNEPESAYDFVYLPIDFKNRCNLGYAFVNFTSALATLKFFKAFHAQAWEEFNSRKICDIKYARVQGRHALENHFCNSRFACDTLEYLPVVFTPPRNGLESPPPRAAAGLMMMKSGRQGCGAGRALLGSLSADRATVFLSPSKSLPESEPPHEKPPVCESSATKDETEQHESEEIGLIPAHDVVSTL